MAVIVLDFLYLQQNTGVCGVVCVVCECWCVRACVCMYAQCTCVL